MAVSGVWSGLEPDVWFDATPVVDWPYFLFEGHVVVV